MNRNSTPIDDYRHRGLRRKLIKELADKGIYSQAVLDAFNQVPRHFFLDKAFEELAYQDRPLPIGCAQTISQPYTVALQSQLLDIKKGDKVLEIGTGSGFQASILCALGARVYTIERQEALFRKTVKNLKQIGFPQIRCYLSDGFEGLPIHAPFKKIIVTAAPKELPVKLIDQLAVGGIMVLPWGDQKNQKMVVLTKTSPTTYKLSEKDDAYFVPMLEGVNK
ncbi:MAG: protein-L-isoaspartate(D-aspartate) O-methyltransferase [Saprospiraceae bacterium]|nr:protein-L-isoaspartate(D-aspartate) O-methyltransferase [Saprospiraceae bacterium]